MTAVDRIVSLHVGGATPSQIARRLHLSHAEVCAILNQAEGDSSRMNAVRGHADPAWPLLHMQERSQPDPWRSLAAAILYQAWQDGAAMWLRGPEARGLFDWLDIDQDVAYAALMCRGH